MTDDHTNAHATEAANLDRSSIRWGWFVLAVLVLIGGGWLFILFTRIVLPHDPASFFRGEMLTPVVQPTGRSVASRSSGSVRMRIWVDSPLDPRCLVSTQFFIRYNDGSMTKAPGMRSTSQGEVKESIYEASVPLGSPSGDAEFFVRDTYNCGLLAEAVQSSPMHFNVLPSFRTPAATPEGISE